VTVFARTDPTQKLAIIRAWQERGHVVAMTGDGVNDGPALRRADIGIAMGAGGTELARQAADLVLTDDDLATVLAAAEEGRRVYANVRRFLLYGLAGGMAEILVMLLGPAFGMALPLLPAQILWINLLTHGLPGVALGAEPAEPDVMARGPRPPAQSVIGAGLWRRVLTVGVVVTATSLAVGVWAHHTGREWQTMLFLALAMAQFGVALGVRARPGTWQNPFLLLALAAAYGLQVAGVALAPLRSLLETRPLTVGQVAAVSLVAVAGYLAARLARRR
jgi:Ca2+-transporting ATPase